MKKTRLLILFFALPVILVVSFYLRVPSPVKPHVQTENCVEIPLNFIPFLSTPIIEVEIENSKYALDLDLGCAHHLCLHSEIIKKIKGRQSIDPIDSFGVDGKLYSLAGFRIPKMRIQNYLRIEGAIAREENIDFLLHGCQILPDIPFLHRIITKLYMAKVDGRLGWPLFKEMSCLFDFSNSVMFVGKDMKSLLEGMGCSLDAFVQIPFELKREGVVLTVETELGRKRFLLDTGSTWSLFNKSGRTDHSVTINKFQIGETDFGRSTFQLYDFSPLIEVDGILGADFFKKRAICLNFQSKTAYIEP